MQASASPSDGQTVHPAGFPRAIRLPGVSAGGSFRYSISLAPVAGIIRGYPRRARAADESAPRVARDEGCGVQGEAAQAPHPAADERVRAVGRASAGGGAICPPRDVASVVSRRGCCYSPKPSTRQRLYTHPAWDETRHWVSMSAAISSSVRPCRRAASTYSMIPAIATPCLLQSAGFLLTKLCRKTLSTK